MIDTFLTRQEIRKEFNKIVDVAAGEGIAPLSMMLTELMIAASKSASIVMFAGLVSGAKKPEDIPEIKAELMKGWGEFLDTAEKLAVKKAAEVSKEG